MAKKLANKEKAKAWDKFSRFIRIRDCLQTTGLPFVGICVTCGRRFHIRNLQSGHCIPGRSNAKLFDENLTNIQCSYCNEYKHGQRKKYEAVMKKWYGDKEFEQMKIEARKVIQDKDMDFPAIAAKNKEKYEKIMHDYGYHTWQELLQGKGGE